MIIKWDHRHSIKTLPVAAYQGLSVNMLWSETSGWFRWNFYRKFQLYPLTHTHTHTHRYPTLYQHIRQKLIRPSSQTSCLFWRKGKVLIRGRNPRDQCHLIFCPVLPRNKYTIQSERGGDREGGMDRYFTLIQALRSRNWQNTNYISVLNVTVIVVGYGIRAPGSNSGQVFVCYSLFAYAFRKGMNPILLLVLL